jgi:asparagine synthase (glutamine-hydrolysing)
MRASVEVRVPFLDLQFIELVERMPSRYKVSRIGERKWLYRQAAARYLPPVLARRLGGLGGRIGRKQGFTTPLERWLDEGGGPLAAPQRWMEPLIARGLLTRSAVTSFAAATERPGGTMQRELLAVYSLSQWVAALAA